MTPQSDLAKLCFKVAFKWLFLRKMSIEDVNALHFQSWVTEAEVTNDVQ